MSTQKMDSARSAANALDDGAVIGLGEYLTQPNGSSDSLKATLPIQFVRHHELESKDELNTWMDSKTGALIVMPGDNR
ncbi:hypothetical protein OB905_13140 [Halobacteria archaeon AArc-dxtr1]|nr:hypothetical protein [Halobacteria archaeon AArc-dxtr1]